jgi:Protein kinase domain
MYKDHTEVFAVRHPQFEGLPEPWPPSAPDITIQDSINLTEQEPFPWGFPGMMYKYREGNRTMKHNATDHEFQMMKNAGSCSVKPLGRVLMRDKCTGKIEVTGIIMDLEEKFDWDAVPPDQRATTANQMIRVVHELHHTHRVIHGDIRPENMLIRCSDNQITLCDFAEARGIDDDPNLWEGWDPSHYAAPSRGHAIPPTVVDDLYALGLSIWQIYSGRIPFDGFVQDEIEALLSQDQAVDLDLITDDEIKEIVADYLRAGGADVRADARECPDETPMTDCGLEKYRPGFSIHCMSGLQWVPIDDINFNTWMLVDPQQESPCQSRQLTAISRRADGRRGRSIIGGSINTA